MGLKTEIIHKIISSLQEIYGTPQKPDKNIPILDQIILSILDTNEDAAKVRTAYKAIKTEFVDWNELRVTHPREIQETISKYLEENVSEKSHKIRDVLSRIFNLCNTLNLQFLWDSDFSEIQKFLQQIHGLNENIIYKLLSYGYYQPLEAHFSPSFIRVGKRINLWSEGISQSNLKKIFIKDIGAEKLFYLHVLLFQHGEAICLPKGYECAKCVISKYCEKGIKELSSKKKGRQIDMEDENNDVKTNKKVNSKKALNSSIVKKTKKILATKFSKRKNSKAKSKLKK